VLITGVGTPLSDLLTYTLPELSLGYPGDVPTLVDAYDVSSSGEITGLSSDGGFDFYSLIPSRAGVVPTYESVDLTPTKGQTTVSLSFDYQTGFGIPGLNGIAAASYASASFAFNVSATTTLQLDVRASSDGSAGAVHNQLQAQLDPTGTTISSYRQLVTTPVDRPTVDSVAGALHYDNFGWLQIITQTIDGLPATPARCEDAYSSLAADAAKLAAMCSEAIGRPMFDTPLGLETSAIPYVSGAVLSDAPCAPGGWQMSFFDLLVGIDGDKLHLVGPSPYFSTPTDFTWQYAGDNSFFSKTCGGLSSTGPLFQSDSDLAGIGVASFTGYADLSSLPPEIDSLLKSAGLTVPEPSGVLDVLAGLVCLVLATAWRLHKTCQAGSAPC